MSGTVFTKFFWSDWDTDQKLKLCSLAAQGFWMRLLCIAASHDPIGYVAVSGRPLSVTDTARLTGASETEVETLTEELARNDVFSRDRHGRIYSRRMVKDSRASAEAKKNGKLGGNPNLTNHSTKPPGVKARHKPRHKPQEPSATTKVRAPNSALDLGGRASPLLPDEGQAPTAPENVVDFPKPEIDRKAMAAELLGLAGGLGRRGRRDV